MKPIIVLDSGPLGLLMQQAGVRPADLCRSWVAARLRDGCQFLIPEIADYEVRRELVRLQLTAGLTRFDNFNKAHHYLPLTTAAMRLAADLWAQVRAVGKPTADRHALDGDVILAAQVLSAGYDPKDFVVASTNTIHLTRLVPAEAWDRI